MYHPYIRQKIFEARAQELERIAAEDRTAQVGARPIPRRDWSELLLRRRRAVVPGSVRVDAGGPPAER